MRLRVTKNEHLNSVTIPGSFHAKPGVIVHMTPSAIAVKFPGYRENPGSRYSGLMSYYSPETRVYKILSVIEQVSEATRILDVEHVITWENKRSK